MKKALVTGASSGIGLEISKTLIKLGFLVYAIGRDFEKCKFKNKNFVETIIDLESKDEILKLKKIKDISILVNCAGVGYFGSYESLSFEQIEQMIAVNLTAPLFLTKLFLNPLKKNSGYIFNIASISALKPAIFGVVYGATKSGLRHFGKSLFNESRKTGLKVININPDITKTPWFDKLNFTYTNDPLNFIPPQEIAKIIQNILELKEGTVVSDITIEPQKFKICKNI